MILEREKRIGERGESLIGVLVAVLLCSILILGTIQMITYGTQINLKAKRDTKAFALAQEKMEELLRAPLSSTELAEGTYESEPEPGYILTWVVTEDDPAPNSRSLLVRVEAGRGDDARCVSLLEYRY
jgi:Tfp pilus assembly protein PilV